MNEKNGRITIPTDQDVIQQMYLMTPFYMAEGDTLSIHLMNHLYPDMLTPNSRDDSTRWWEVIDRTTGESISAECWHYDDTAGDVTIETLPYHEYMVSFLVYIMWDPVHMYNAVTNEWKEVEHQITFDVRQPKTHAYTRERLKKFIQEHPYVDVLRFTTFFINSPWYLMRWQEKNMWTGMAIQHP